MSELVQEVVPEAEGVRIVCSENQMRLDIIIPGDDGGFLAAYLTRPQPGAWEVVAVTDTAGEVTFGDEADIPTNLREVGPPTGRTG